ncbi:head-tail connector protein [Bacillus sp. FSL M8-0077]|uniref:head-tail connector protein n=1 Tax=Bacillus sp. FSL M8-0077 TaxID=2954556 RepID=UPI0030FD8911
MSIDLEKVKHFLRVDGDEDDVLIEELIASAAEYLENAGVKEAYKQSALYGLAVKLLVQEWFDNRGVNPVSHKLYFSLQSIILQLK